MGSVCNLLFPGGKKTGDKSIFLWYLLHVIRGGLYAFFFARASQSPDFVSSLPDQHSFLVWPPSGGFNSQTSDSIRFLAVYLKAGHRLYRHMLGGFQQLHPNCSW